MKPPATRHARMPATVARGDDFAAVDPSIPAVDTGGHFVAWERPQPLGQKLRAAFRSWR